MTLSDEQIQDLLRVGNPSAEECRLIRMGWDAALARMRTTAVPDGWKLVPIEPTEDMLRAMTDPFIAINGDNRKAFEIAYTAMLSAAPEVKP